MARRLLQARVRMMLGAPRPKTFGKRDGFTLVELMIVVAIVGVLAIIAVVGYRKLILAGKITEAKNVVSGVRLAQEEYKTERGIYANIGASLCPLPNSGTQQVKTAWDVGCNGGTGTWSMLPFHPDGPVQFGYATVAGVGTPPATIGQPIPFVTVPGAVGTNPWYYVTGSADLDGTGGAFTEVVGTSFAGTVFTFQEGE